MPGRPKAPAVCLRRTGKFPPAGVGFRVEGDPGVGDAFGPAEDALNETFVTALFQGLRDGVPEQGVTRLPVKQVGLALPDPSQTAPENWTASCVITEHLVAALRGQVDYGTADHSACLREVRTVVRRRGQIRAEEALAAAVEGAPVLHAHRLQRAAKNGAWIIVQPSTVNGTDLEAQEWRDALFLRYGLEPLNLPTYCDGCQAKFSNSHALEYKKCSLITACQNELRDRVADLAGKAFTPSHVRNNPLIYSGCAVKRKKAAPVGANGNSGHTAAPEITEQNGELLIRDLCQ